MDAATRAGGISYRRPFPKRLDGLPGSTKAGSTKGHIMTKANDPNSYQARVNYAAQCFLRGTKSRAFDSCFEMYDGDAVVVALVRRASKNEKLHAAIARDWGGTFPALWLDTARKYEDIPTRQLAALAAQIRAENEARFESWLAEQTSAAA